MSWHQTEREMAAYCNDSTPPDSSSSNSAKLLQIILSLSIIPQVQRRAARYLTDQQWSLVIIVQHSQDLWLHLALSSPRSHLNGDGDGDVEPSYKFFRRLILILYSTSVNFFQVSFTTRPDLQFWEPVRYSLEYIAVYCSFIYLPRLTAWFNNKPSLPRKYKN